MVKANQLLDQITEQAPNKKTQQLQLVEQKIREELENLWKMAFLQVQTISHNQDAKNDA